MPDERKIAEGLALLREGAGGIQPDCCPKCGSTDIDCDYSEGLGEILYEKCSCDSCGAVWRNHYEFFQQEIIEGGDQP